MRTSVLSCFTALFISTITGSVLAQGAPETAPAEQPAAEAEAPSDAPAAESAPSAEVKADVKVDVKAKAKTKAGPRADADEEEEEEGEDSKMKVVEDPGRFRGGVSGLVGVFVPGPVVQLGVEGRLGYQINDLMAVYGDLGTHAGFGINVGASEEGASTSVSFGGGIYWSALFEVTLEDVFFVGVGPTLLYGSFVSVDQYASVDSATQSVSAFSGLLPGLKLRLGVGFGKETPGRRKQFTLAAQCSMLFGQSYEVRQSASGSSVDQSASAGVAVGFLPMLALGYDAK
ncbi:MAG: hypothetical protein HOW73_18485 [Polyangiaceae bacterium]|nr:hypothetical protein [Polyangiaceae bacterium]